MIFQLTFQHFGYSVIRQRIWFKSCTTTDKERCYLVSTRWMQKVEIWKLGFPSGSIDHIEVPLTVPTWPHTSLPGSGDEIPESLNPPQQEERHYSLLSPSRNEYSRSSVGPLWHHPSNSVVSIQLLKDESLAAPFDSKSGDRLQCFLRVFYLVLYLSWPWGLLSKPFAVARLLASPGLSLAHEAKTKPRELSSASFLRSQYISHPNSLLTLFTPPFSLCFIYTVQCS